MTKEQKTNITIGRTAATDRYLIERDGSSQVNLCERIGGRWVTICGDITIDMAESRGFKATQIMYVFEHCN